MCLMLDEELFRVLKYIVGIEMGVGFCGVGDIFFCDLREYDYC